MNALDHHQQDARQLYRFYRIQGVSPGSDLLDWLEAERARSKRCPREHSGSDEESPRPTRVRRKRTMKRYPIPYPAV